jgi:putative ABC transport system substrate-binding protein
LASKFRQRCSLADEVIGSSDFEVAFDVLAKRRVGGFVVAADAFFLSQRDQLIAMAARRSLPAIYHQREFPQSGGLMSYGTNLADAFRQVAALSARILKGEKPADMPVIQPTKFELVINLKTAKALNLDIPPGVLAIADEVVE